MRERAEELGGTLVVESASGGGTHIEAQLPLDTVPRRASPAVAGESAEPDHPSLPAPEGHRA